MRSSKFTEEQIAFALKQAETGTPVKEIIRKIEGSPKTGLVIIKHICLLYKVIP